MSALLDRSHTGKRDQIDVLIVDDVLPIVEEMLTLLQLTGIPAVAASSLEEAMAALEEYRRISIVVCDVRLGKQSGVDLVRLAQANPCTASRQLHFVFMTGDPMGVDQFPNGLHSAILTKPVRPRELIALVTELLAAGLDRCG